MWTCPSGLDSRTASTAVTTVGPAVRVVITMSNGAIDNDWEDSELSTEASMLAAIEDLDHELSAGDVAIDLVTRQPLYLHEQVADDLAEYKEENDFDLFSYKTHPYLPVRLDDRVFECVFVTNDPSQAHNAGKTYDYPEGRLMKLPLAEAWNDE